MAAITMAMKKAPKTELRIAITRVPLFPPPPEFLISKGEDVAVVAPPLAIVSLLDVEVPVVEVVVVVRSDVEEEVELSVLEEVDVDAVPVLEVGRVVPDVVPLVVVVVLLVGEEEEEELVKEDVEGKLLVHVVNATTVVDVGNVVPLVVEEVDDDVAVVDFVVVVDVVVVEVVLVVADVVLDVVDDVTELPDVVVVPVVAVVVGICVS